MLVGLCSIDLDLRGATSLKDKRKVIKSLVDRVHNRFNVSIAEVEYQDYWQRSQLGVACVSNERQHLQQVLQQVVNYIEKSSEAEIRDYYIEML